MACVCIIIPFTQCQGAVDMIIIMKQMYDIIFYANLPVNMYLTEVGATLCQYITSFTIVRDSPMNIIWLISDSKMMDAVIDEWIGFN